MLTAKATVIVYGPDEANAVYATANDLTIVDRWFTHGLPLGIAVCLTYQALNINEANETAQRAARAGRGVVEGEVKVA